MALSLDSQFYWPLDERRVCICLLHLLPALAFEHPIRCDLQHAMSLLDAPQYEALSYCWGKSVDTACIQVNGTGRSVSTSMASALRHLRQTHQQRHLWVDGICINQDDHNERSAQVGLMKRIYQQAAQVTVWLGGPGDDSAAVFELMDQLAIAAAQSVESGDRRHMYRADMADKRPVPTGKTWMPLFRLLSRPYFGRVWVIQEVTFGCQSPNALRC